jgi:hypothetical protein
MCKWGTNTIVKLCKPKPVSGRTEIGVDSCIAPLVQALNDAGIATRACCCGHGKGLGDIMLEDGRELMIAQDYDTARKIEKMFYGRRKWLINLLMNLVQKGKTLTTH